MPTAVPGAARSVIPVAFSVEESFPPFVDIFQDGSCYTILGFIFPLN